MLTKLLAETSVPEREHYDRDTANALARLCSRLAAVERYRIVRKYCHGVVVDAACGCGYGSWIISKCPDVTEVHGFDIDEPTIAFATQQYGDAATFTATDLCAPTFLEHLERVEVDTVVSLETIEHLDEWEGFFANVTHSPASRWVLTFPCFETVRFNPYHRQDFTPNDVSAALGVEPTKSLVIDDAVALMVFDL